MSEPGRVLKEIAGVEAERGARGAADRFAGRAAEAGLVDVAYGHAESPLGRLLVASTPRGLVRVGFLSSEPEERVVAELAASVSPRVLAVPPRLDDVRRQLEDYFAGRRRRFEVPLDWRLARGFGRDVLRATARLGYGETASYAEVAARAGSPRAYRAAGNALHRNPMPIVVPCHRVLHADGGLGGYGGGLEAKERLLRLEGAL